MQETMTEPLVDSASGNVEEGGEAGKNEDAVFNRLEMLHLSVSSFWSWLHVFDIQSYKFCSWYSYLRLQLFFSALSSIICLAKGTKYN